MALPAEAEKYQFVQEPFCLLPWTPDDHELPDDIIVRIWSRLKDEGLRSIVFHERSDATLTETIGFFANPKNPLQLLYIVKNGQVQDLAGFAWLAEFEVCDAGLTKAVGSFCFFRAWQSPHWTNRFGDMILDYWFNVLGLKTLIGSTPFPNALARAYAHRMGLKTAGRIQDWTTYDGKICDAVISTMTASAYRSRKALSYRQMGGACHG